MKDHESTNDQQHMNPYILYFTLGDLTHIAVCLADSCAMAQARLLARLPEADILDTQVVATDQIAILSPKTTEEDLELTALDHESFMSLTTRPIETSRLENIPFDSHED